MSRSKKTQQFELRAVGEVFNLVQETGPDPLRVILDRLHQAAEQAERRSYELKMQRVFSECPGFIGGDAPETERGIGHVVVEPGQVLAAREWLGRRFICNDKLEVEPALNGIRIELAPRPRKQPGKKRVKVSFEKPEQFTLNFQNESK